MTTSTVDPDLLDRAVAILRRGGLVAYPSDTVYGLAALPADARAVARLFEAKKRDPEQPVPFLIASPDNVALLAAVVPDAARQLVETFWPGALTIILHKAQSFQSDATGATIGLRVPDHPVPRDLSRLLGAPITGTSANLAGGPEPLTADDVRSQLGDAVDLIIDGGPCPGGRPSTVVDCTAEPPRVMRAGAINPDMLARATGLRLA